MRSDESSSRTSSRGSTGFWTWLKLSLLSMIAPTGLVISVVAFTLTTDLIFLVPFALFLILTTVNQP